MPGFNFLGENCNILIRWSLIPCCGFYLSCNTNSHEIIKTADYLLSAKLNCGPSEESALVSSRNHLKYQSYLDLRQCSNYKTITLHTCSPYSGLLPVEKKDSLRNKQELSSLVNRLHFISTKQAGDRNIKKKRSWHSTARDILVKNGIILTPLTLCKQNI